MSPRQFAVSAGATGLLLVAALVIVVAGGADWSFAVAVDKLFQLGFSLAAFGGFLYTARKATGAERRWRLWMAAAMASLSIGMSAWIWGQLIMSVPLPTTTLAPVSFIMVPVLTLFGVISLVHDEPTQHPEPARHSSTRRGRVLLGLDALIICGSVFVLVLVCALQSVFSSWPRTAPALATVVAHPAAYLVLLAVVATLARSHRVICQPPILLLSLASVAQSTSGWLFAAYVGDGASRIPPAADSGFIACPVLFALAAVAPFAPLRPKKPSRRRGLWLGDYLTVAMPYLPLAVTCLFVVFSTATGGSLMPLEIDVGLAVIGLVILRQLVTLMDNMRLLRQLTESQRQLEHQAFHDPLTGLANRTLFLRRLADAVAVHDRDERPLVLLFVDIDGFKTVNDNFGHGAGDAVLRTVAERLMVNVREGDLVARLGGDEFSVLLDSTDNMDAAAGSRRISQQLLDSLCAPQVVRGRDMCISASIGTVSLCAFDPDLTPDELLRRADEAMYAAKRRGKGALVVYGDTTPNGTATATTTTSAVTTSTATTPTDLQVDSARA